MRGVAIGREGQGTGRDGTGADGGSAGKGKVGREIAAALTVVERGTEALPAASAQETRGGRREGQDERGDATPAASSRAAEEVAPGQGKRTRRRGILRDQVGHEGKGLRGDPDRGWGKLGEGIEVDSEVQGT